MAEIQISTGCHMSVDASAAVHQNQALIDKLRDAFQHAATTESFRMTCTKCRCNNRYENGPWSTCESTRCQHPMRDHRIDSLTMSKNELLALINETLKNLNELESPTVAQMCKALQEVHDDLDRDEKPLFAIGTWRRLRDALKRPDSLDNYSRRRFEEAAFRLRHLHPGDDVRW
jgi:hypothetical protein